MISRVAESCFWLHRQIERADNTARLLSVNRNFVLDVALPAQDRWWPIIVVVGEQVRIRRFNSDPEHMDGNDVQEYLTWNPDNPTSIYSAIREAREGARTIREVISLEMWETINSFWHWLKSGPGRRQYREDPDAFYRRVRETASMFQGTCHNTMLHEAPFDFMRLGMLLERAGWTARIVDVKHHMLDALEAGSSRSALESAHGMALLRSCSATEPFFKHVQTTPTPRRVVEFLLLAPTFPRSVLHCLDRTRNFLQRIRPESGKIGEHSASLLDGLLADLGKLEFEELFETRMHDELTRIINRVSEVSTAIRADYFDPQLSLQSQSQSQGQ